VRANQAAIDIIKAAEGLRLEAYRCPAGVWTIGYGHTKGVVPGQVISAEQAEEFLRADLEDFENAVWELVKTQPPTENQFGAMVSLAFNIGMTNFQRSSVLRTFRAGDLHGARESFAMWNKAKVNGVLKSLLGLLIRRRREATLFGEAP
jgi:lysozyme